MDKGRFNFIKEEHGLSRDEYYSPSQSNSVPLYLRCKKIEDSILSYFTPIKKFKELKREVNKLEGKTFVNFEETLQKKMNNIISWDKIKTLESLIEDNEMLKVAKIVLR